jgi:uncharacterized protein YjbI with pentapeptide repeats
MEIFAKSDSQCPSNLYASLLWSAHIYPPIQTSQMSKSGLTTAMLTTAMLTTAILTSAMLTTAVLTTAMLITAMLTNGMPDRLASSQSGTKMRKPNDAGNDPVPE